MTPKQRLELNELAYNNAALYALLQVLDHGKMPEHEWWHFAVVKLTDALNAMIRAAIEAEKRVQPRPFILTLPPKPSPASPASAEPRCRWRDGVDLSKDIPIYLELLAKCFDIKGHSRYCPGEAE